MRCVRIAARLKKNEYTTMQTSLRRTAAWTNVDIALLYGRPDNRKPQNTIYKQKCEQYIFSEFNFNRMSGNQDIIFTSLCVRQASCNFWHSLINEIFLETYDKILFIIDIYDMNPKFLYCFTEHLFFFLFFFVF